MKKIVSLSYPQKTFLCLKIVLAAFVNNSVFSCASILYYLIFKDPLFFIKLPFILSSKNHDINSKIKTVMGNAMVGTGAEMFCKLIGLTNASQHKKAMDICSIIINIGFCFLTGQGIHSKSKMILEKTLCHDIEENHPIEMNKVKSLIKRQMLSELDFFLTSLLVAAVAMGSLADKLPTDDHSQAFLKYLGVLKAFNYITGHLNSLYHHKNSYELLNHESKQFYQDNIKGLWYSANHNDELEFNMNYLQAGISTNVVMGIFATTALLVGCNGPKGPSGEASCTKGSQLEIGLLIFHIISMNWLGGSLLKPATSKTSLTNNSACRSTQVLPE